MSNSYPKWQYHKTKPAVVVADAAEAKALGSGWHDEPATMTGDEVFDTFLADNGMDKVPARYQAMIRIAYDHVIPASASTIPTIEYGHPVGPQDEVGMVDSEVARKALLAQAKEMGVNVHHASSSKTIQAAIDAKTAVKSSTPAAATAMPKETDIDKE